MSSGVVEVYEEEVDEEEDGEERLMISIGQLVCPAVAFR